MEATHLDAKGPQKIECVVAEPKAEGFYETLKVARTPQPSMSCGPSFFKRCIVPLSTTVSGLTSNEHMPAPRILPLPAQQLKTANIPAKTAPICINIGDIQWVYCCWVKWCHEVPSASWAASSVQVHCVHLGAKLAWPLCSTIEAAWQAAAPYYLHTSILMFCVFVLYYIDPSYKVLNIS